MIRQVWTRTVVLLFSVAAGLQLIGCAGTESAPNEAPAAVFSITPEVAVSYGQVVVDASASDDSDGRIVDYSWAFGDGTTGSGEIVTHTYTTGDETHTVVLTVTDDDGRVSTRTADLLVIACQPCGSP